MGRSSLTHRVPDALFGRQVIYIYIVNNNNAFLPLSTGFLRSGPVLNYVICKYSKAPNRLSLSRLHGLHNLLSVTSKT